MAKRTEPTGWVGWVYFAGAMLLAVGGLQIIAGLAALFRDDFYVVTSNHLVAFSYTTWGWIELILGIVLLLAGIGIWAGQGWARIVGVFVAVLALLSNFAFITAYPLWSIFGVVISGLIIYALTVHGGEVA
jgi:hypothetical protein